MEKDACFNIRDLSKLLWESRTNLIQVAGNEIYYITMQAISLEWLPMSGTINEQKSGLSKNQDSLLLANLNVIAIVLRSYINNTC